MITFEFTKDKTFQMFARLSTAIESLADNKKYIVEIKEKRLKRSLDANAYFWELCGQLSAVVHISPKEIYKALIPDVGGNYEIVPIRDEAVNMWISIWESKGDGFICETLSSKLDGYTNIKCYFGSSTYDTRQMSRLIDLLVIECKNNGISTDTEQITSLLNDWSDKSGI